MRRIADCTSVVLLLGDPFTVCGELTRTLAALKTIPPRFDVLLVCDGPAWRREPAVQSFLVHGPRPGLLQTRSCVDHPTPLLRLALDWLRTPLLHLLWPGVVFRPDAVEPLCDALHDSRAVLASGRDGVTAHGCVVRAESLRRAELCPAPASQTALERQLADLGETLTLPAVGCDEPRWAWADYPFLRRWPAGVGVGRVRVAA